MGEKNLLRFNLFGGIEDGTLYPYLYKSVTKENQGELQLVMFLNVKIGLNKLFDV